VTVIMGVVVGLTVLFGFGNVLSLGLRLGDEEWHVLSGPEGNEFCLPKVSPRPAMRPDHGRAAEDTDG
jgi:hypothetical protein